jgi:hypothetical protein
MTSDVPLPSVSPVKLVAVSGIDLFVIGVMENYSQI